jgi:hypothetical protein
MKEPKPYIHTSKGSIIVIPPNYGHPITIKDSRSGMSPNWVLHIGKDHIISPPYELKHEEAYVYLEKMIYDIIATIWGYDLPKNKKDFNL